MEATARPFAHSVNVHGERDLLVDHLEATAERAAEFGALFGQRDACYAAGLWHDIGKATPAFQEYLRACEEQRPHARVNHKDAGAVLAARLPETVHLAPLLLGHHGGIADIGDVATVLQSAQERSDVMDALQWSWRTLLAPPAVAALPSSPASERDLVMRLIFSALVDADFLDTERHFDVDRSSMRQHRSTAIVELEAAEQLAYEQFLAERRTGCRVDGIRSEIRNVALGTASAKPGLFRLTVPTGGGKTKTGLAFALRHAVRWDLRRVVVAVPFLTITDQVAATYCEMLGPEAVLEHHSGVEPLTSVTPQARVWARLSAENWDASVIVTTTVQLFASLFSNGPSSLRKAHQLARSVLILDEAQTIPLRVLGVTVDALTALTRAAGASVVLCTATQPALEQIEHSLTGKVREIVPQFSEHFAALRRVSFAVPATTGSWSWARVASEAQAVEQVMVVVNRRRDALAVLEHLDEHAHHLSTLLCGVHRRAVLKAVQTALQAGRPCRLVATQVVEAGVDLDFPLVLRALAPFDSVVQAAGRCNREGRLPEGRCIVFRPEVPDALGAYRRGIDTLKGMLAEGDVDFGDPRACSEYYRRLYGQGSVTNAVVDPAGIRDHVEEYLFATVASEYRVIEEETRSVLVLYPPMRARVERLIAAVGRADRPERARFLLRQLQPFVVGLRPRDVAAARTRRLVEDHAGLLLWVGAYDRRLGVAGVLTLDEAPQPVVGSGGVII